MLGLLRRNLQFCPEQCKRTAYIALTRSILEYGAGVWDPIPSKRHRKPRTCSTQGSPVSSQGLQIKRPRLHHQHETTTKPAHPSIKETSTQTVILLQSGRGLVPGLPIDNFLVKARPKRNIKIKQYKDHQTQNILERQVVNHDKGFKIHHCNTEQLKHSYFCEHPLWLGITSHLK